MKKLNLNFQNRVAGSVLSREQMKTVMGGDDPAVGTVDDGSATKCNVDSDCCVGGVKTLVCGENISAVYCRCTNGGCTAPGCPS